MMCVSSVFLCCSGYNGKATVPGFVYDRGGVLERAVRWWPRFVLVLLYISLSWLVTLHMYKAVLSSWFNLLTCPSVFVTFCLFVCLSFCLSVCLSVPIHWKIWNYTYKIDPHQSSTRADCVAWLVFTTDSRVERLCILLTASNSCHCIVCLYLI